MVMMRKKSRLNSARSRPGEESKAAMVQKNSKMVLECPVLPCWDETDDGVPGVSEEEYYTAVEISKQRLWTIRFKHLDFPILAAF